MKDSLQFKILQQELAPYKTFLAQAADAVIDQDVSNYPIFIVHQEEVSAGIPILEREKTGGKWSIHLSSLEEFVTKNLIETEKIDEFKKVYKDSKKQLCLFVLSELGATFIFLPR